MISGKRQGLRHKPSAGFVLWMLCSLLLPYVSSCSEDAVPASRLSCVLELKDFDDTTAGLISGYAYYMLSEYALQRGDSIDISLAYPSEHCMDSLREGILDIVVLPLGLKGTEEGVLYSRDMDSLMVWCVSGKNKTRLKSIDNWFSSFDKDSLHLETRERFLSAEYSPWRRPSAVGWISPYDDIVRKYAAEIDWDWHMLAAVIWKESHFCISVKSHRGALGLMQIMPSTARRMGLDNSLDPEESIKAGCAYLKLLSRRFARIAADREERDKFTLAAYNAGEGRIQDCIDYASFRGADISHWESVAGLIPEMSNPELPQPDTLNVSGFKGVETIAYVSSILDITDEFRRICPQ